MSKYALVLLSGGMDSAVALFWAAHSKQYERIDALTIDYGQSSRQELTSANYVWNEYWRRYSYPGTHMTLSYDLFPHSDSSILRGTQRYINQYDTVEQAIAGTRTDKSYIPMRNAVLASIASSFLLTQNPKGGDIVMGIRGRTGGRGFPDCTHGFAVWMTEGLSQGAGVRIKIIDPLNGGSIPTRKDTLELARTIPGCFEALRYTSSCFKGLVPPCGHCLPCLRRAQAFQELGRPDPILAKVYNV